jgi:hypothetical protein
MMDSHNRTGTAKPPPTSLNWGLLVFLGAALLSGPTTFAADQVGVFRPPGGSWFLDGNGSNTWDDCGADLCFTFGAPVDLPVTGDWNGDGITDIGVKRGGQWFIDRNGNGVWDDCRDDVDDLCLTFGVPSDLPVTGDWGETGREGIGEL